MPSLPKPATGGISFQYLAEIAVGDTARVDLCRAVGGEHAGQLLAVKRLHPHVAEDPTFANMFLDEVWMTAALKHPNVVEVAGWGTDAQGVYLAVELVQGVSLVRLMKTVFETGEVFTERMVVFIASQLCAGLAAAHALRSPEGEFLTLVHRDLTPGNVLVSFSGGVKIADFGLAKAKQRVTKTLTGLLKGKPQYMAPEQARGGVPIDGRADLFSLGVMLFELFSGRRPWSATSELQMVHVTANEPPLDLRELRPKIDKELVAIVEGCLEKDPAARFQSAGELSARFDQWLSTHGYLEGNEEALGRFIRRNSMRQMRWFERAVAGELAPMSESMRPPRPDAPQAPDAAAANAVPRPNPADAKRARVKPRKQLDSEGADLTAAERNMAGLRNQIRSDPTVRETNIVDSNPANEGSEDESELVPTLVQKATDQLADLRARGIGRAAVRPPAAVAVPHAIVDEESDNRTTGVRRGTTQRPAGRTSAAARELSDLESGDLPTQPVSGRAHAPPPQQRVETTEAFPSALLAAPKLPGQVAQPSASVPDPPQRPRVSTPPGAPTPMEDPRHAMGASSGSPQITAEFIAREADRFAVEAARFHDESNAAAALATHKATLAKIAAEAAGIAAEAVRMTANGDIRRAALRLEEARALEETMRRREPPAHPSGQRPRASYPPAALPQASPPAVGPRASAVGPGASASGVLPMIATTDSAMFMERLRPFGGMRREAVFALAGGALFLIALVAWLVVR